MVQQQNSLAAPQVAMCYGILKKPADSFFELSHLTTSLQIATLCSVANLISAIQGDIDTLERVQERAVNMVAGLKGATYEEKCAELGLQTLEARREGKDMALVHKFLMNDSGTELFRRLASQERARTRQVEGGYGLAVQFARTDPRKYLFSVRAVEKWNKLPVPEEVRAAPSRAAFRDMIKNL